jgi:hypothetical protein
MSYALFHPRLSRYLLGGAAGLFIAVLCFCATLNDQPPANVTITEAPTPPVGLIQPAAARPKIAVLPVPQLIPNPPSARVAATSLSGGQSSQLQTSVLLPLAALAVGSILLIRRARRRHLQPRP